MKKQSWQCGDQALVVILCDCDPDRTAYGGPAYNVREALRWRGVQEGIPRLIEALDRIESETGRRISITWCVRSDLQIKEIYGEAAWPYLQFRELWQELEARGDEIAWHPHLWRWSDQHRCWYQEICDAAWMEECLETGYRALSRAVARRILACRMGWEFHNNTTMQTIDRLGVTTDFSGVPGHYCEGMGDRGSVFHKYTDWRGTPPFPYHPSVADYRRPAIEGEEELGITEVPLWGYVPFLWRFLGRVYVVTKHLAHGRLKEALSLRKETMFHIPAFTMSPMIFASSIRKKHYLRKPEETAVVAVAFHCDELLGTGGFRGKIYGLRHAIDNARTALTFGTTTTASRLLNEDGAKWLKGATL